jgi:cholesterol transport system auxiliary component
MRAALAALAVAAAGCALLAPPADSNVTTAMLDKMPGDLPRGEPAAASLLVLAPETKPVYDTTQMAYTARPHEVAYFSRHRWGETPSQMLQSLLVKTLEATGRFSAVLSPPYTGRYSYALRTEILELTQDFTSEPAALRISLRLQLSSTAADGSIATREISIREPLRQKTPSAGVAAANDAAARALREAAGFVLQNTR